MMLCSLCIPVDVQNSPLLLAHQAETLDMFLHNVLNFQTSEWVTRFMDMLLEKVFTFYTRLECVLPIEWQAENYRDPSTDALLPFYAKLEMLAEKSKEGTLFYEYLDNPRVVLRLFDLLIAPDRRERTAVARIITSITAEHKWLAKMVMEQIFAKIDEIDQHPFDQARACMVPDLIGLLERYPYHMWHR